ncbi:3-deoxy-8-phosphooctulonate synthase [bacterium]|nr:3-deoxy-8-phosphooctulonate synthase [bacterium]
MRDTFDIAGIPVGGGSPLFLIAGPCVLESRELAETVCGCIHDITARLGMGFIFKSSYDKANRQSIGSYRGPGIEEGLDILARIRETFNVPVLTDVHSPEEAHKAGEIVDVLQIPAFLCRQTDLAVACGKTGKPVTVKKGQFMAPGDMGAIAGKIEEGGSDRIMLVERGSTFGYHDLVVDMRSFPVMRSLGCPVVHDCTHSVQRPGAGGDRSGGDRRFIGTLARAAVAAGVDGVFIETHPDCSSALCDSATMLPLEKLEELLKTLAAIDTVVKKQAL